MSRVRHGARLALVREARGELPCARRNQMPTESSTISAMITSQSSSAMFWIERDADHAQHQDHHGQRQEELRDQKREST